MKNLKFVFSLTRSLQLGNVADSWPGASNKCRCDTSRSLVCSYTTQLAAINQKLQRNTAHTHTHPKAALINNNCRHTHGGAHLSQALTNKVSSKLEAASLPTIDEQPILSSAELAVTTKSLSRFQRQSFPELD